MREHMARVLALLSSALILLAVLTFGAVQNKSAVEADEPLDPERVAAGKIVYETNGCAICHAIAGEGDPQYPLDGVGARLSAQQLQQNIAPTPDMQSKFAEVVFEMKQGYHDLSEADMTDLVLYLRSLR